MRVRRRLGFVALGLAPLVMLLSAEPSRAAPIIDQQRPEVPALSPGVTFLGINLDNSVVANIGQTFTPALTSLDFVTLNLQDGNPGNGSGGSFFVEILGPDLSTALGKSGTISLPDGFGTGSFASIPSLEGSPAMFTFSAPVAITPGTTYEIRAFKDSGDLFRLMGLRPGGYPGGRYVGSTLDDDLFFSEGISGPAAPPPPPPPAVPEPSSLTLLALGGAALAGWRRWKRHVTA